MKCKIFGKKRNPYFNSEGYADPTAYYAIKSADSELDRQISHLVKIIKGIVDLTDFEIVGRIELRHTKSGRIYK